MRINITSVFVDDQDKALAFYTEVLGFVVKHDVAMGGPDRWLTVVSPQDPEGTELLLEPSGHRRNRTVQGCAVRRRHPVHAVRGGQCCRRIRSAHRTRCSVHPAAHRDGSGDHCGVRRYLRQSDSDHRSVELTPQTFAYRSTAAPRSRRNVQSRTR